MSRRLVALVAPWILGLASCASSPGDGGLDLGELAVSGLAPATWLEGTRVEVFGQGFPLAVHGTLTATVEGEAGGQRHAFRVPLTVETSGRATFTVTAQVLGLLPLDGPEVVGRLEVLRDGERVSRSTAGVDVRFAAVSLLTPSLDDAPPGDLWPGDEVEVTGAGFLFPGEGLSTAVISGRFLADGTSSWQEIRGVVVPLAATDRGRARFVLTPDVLGPGPGRFEGTIALSNRVADRDEGGDAMAWSTRLNLPYLDRLDPGNVRRGQALRFRGRGFLAVDAEAGNATFFAFTGTETGAEGTVNHPASSPLVLVPDGLDGNQVAMLVVRPVEGPDGRPRGFGSGPAVLDGTWTPNVLAGGRLLVGQGMRARLEVAPTVQVVHVRTLPSFRDGLAAFGLEARATAVRDRMLEVCRGDYADFAVDFRTEAPDDQQEYATVELMGRDPNGANLLGLDNTSGKDVGNLRLDDRLGGYNAAGEAAGFYGYGGVFVESFQGFSPTVGKTDLADPMFDEIFGVVMPGLGGRAGAEREADPAREGAVARAVQTLGNLLGDTLTHELGHSLGLAAVDGEFHDPGDTPGYIMDEGRHRPFVERAQLPGGLPRVFAPYDRAYLEQVLPGGASR